MEQSKSGIPKLVKEWRSTEVADVIIQQDKGAEGKAGKENTEAEAVSVDVSVNGKASNRILQLRAVCLWDQNDRKEGMIWGNHHRK